MGADILGENSRERQRPLIAILINARQLRNEGGKIVAGEVGWGHAQVCECSW